MSPADRGGMHTSSNLGESLLNGRDLAMAREAYKQGDVEASKTAHTVGVTPQRQNASAQAQHSRLPIGRLAALGSSGLRASGRSTVRPAKEG